MTTCDGGGMIVAVLTLTHRQNLVRGDKRGSDNSGVVEKSKSEEKNENNLTEIAPAQEKKNCDEAWGRGGCVVSAWEAVGGHVVGA